MGCNSSKPKLLNHTNGDGKAFLEAYDVDRVIGQGEFGVVKIVFSKQNDPKQQNPIACKILRKGMQFKDNTLYSAIKPHILQTECGILQKLGGKHHNLKLVGIYESPSTLYILTEYMTGGDMFEYVSKYYGATEGGEGLRTEDVSRMSFQLLDAVNHCAKHGIIHRDIKPENVMFKKGERGSPLKLIDFGAGTFCATSNEGIASTRTIQYDLNKPGPPEFDDDKEHEPTQITNAAGDQLHLHTTFAGSAFYISPEMFRTHYTVLTDVWSVGVTLYVLVAGYPADALQEAFNKLQNGKRTIETLKQLPNMPENMPHSFYDMLDSCLIYKHRLRKSAEDVLENCEFVKFHKDHERDEDEDDGNISLSDVIRESVKMKKTTSVLIEGSVKRHVTMLKYTQFERSVTALLASVLVKSELKILLEKIDEVIASHDKKGGQEESIRQEKMTNKKRLQIIKIGELCVILRGLKYDELMPIIKGYSHGVNYDRYAYHVAFLREFYTILQNTERKSDDTNDLDNSMSRKLQTAMAKHDSKLGERTRKSSKKKEAKFEEQIPSSIHNGNAWDTISKKLNMKKERRLSF